MNKLLKIGDVSKLSNLSIKTLRYYEEIKLIKPVEVEIYTGYRYYDDDNLKTLLKIQYLKNLGLSLKEISEFDDSKIDDKIEYLKKQIIQLNKNLFTLSALKNMIGEKIMEPFINDEEVVGKWKYICSALDKERYFQNNCYVDNDIMFNTLYFLPNGKGYWVFNGWTKGIVYHYSGIVYKYEIINNRLLLLVTNKDNEGLYVLVYEKSDSNEYSIDKIQIRDDIDKPFIIDEEAVGYWEAINFIDKGSEDILSTCKMELYLKSMTLTPNGFALVEFKNNIIKQKWTKGIIINEKMFTVSEYKIKKIDNVTYLIKDWKSGDYSFGGKINGCYVFKKIFK